VCESPHFSTASRCVSIPNQVNLQIRGCNALRPDPSGQFAFLQVQSRVQANRRLSARVILLRKSSVCRFTKLLEKTTASHLSMYGCNIPKIVLNVNNIGCYIPFSTMYLAIFVATGPASALPSPLASSNTVITTPLA